MAEEEKSGTEKTTEEAEEEREAETFALSAMLEELETTDDLQGMWDYLEGIVDWHGLNVNMNKGGPNSRTLEQFRDDIIAALHERLAVERMTAQLEQAQIQGGGAAGSNSDSGSSSDDESEAESVNELTAQLAEDNIQAVERVALVNWEEEALGIMGIEHETDEMTRDNGGIDYLRRIVRSMNLRTVNLNVGGWDPRRGRVVTLMDVKFDIDEELRSRMPHEYRGTPYYYNDDGELTNEPILTDAEDSDVDGQAEPQWEQDTDEEESGVVHPNAEDFDYDSDPESQYQQNLAYHN